MSAIPTIYLIGGVPRVGKTITAKKLAKLYDIPYISTDLLRNVVRQSVCGETCIALENATIITKMKYHHPGHREKLTKEHSAELNDDIIAWNSVIALVETCARTKDSMVIEGDCIVPERVTELEYDPSKISVKTIYIGYLDISFYSTMMTYSVKHNDWLQLWIEEMDDEDKVTVIKDWMNERIEKCKKWNRMSRTGFVDVSECCSHDMILAKVLSKF